MAAYIFRLNVTYSHISKSRDSTIRCIIMLRDYYSEDGMVMCVYFVVLSREAHNRNSIHHHDECLRAQI